ncbi:Enamine deaminase RidA, house cleaning of reactive enamine intermediates, YjgF/YER057c/UK114 family [Actinobaculum suis]|uniref:Enamine deaminase RidA, house cleaning of reactive enamine intermediates, YjgF/YER057c/UK114 family n=1 Tax=Actinobaculum suis TaxID=1657 RepID=A0A1G7CQG7_9ACTO|nr:RidA family protein [Actinobaculum suis]MDY5152483.1 RidA family protein [Actinobaculum suis]SDE41473.1 Enamine deaminase RidA, house cleaning of reactive enamine intermediates, YjgF/YER057c/UK114 family [Actinobaculum suis]
MVSVSQRLQELGIDLPNVPAPVAAYVPAKTDHGAGKVRTSGQLPSTNGKLVASGKVEPGEAATAAGYARVSALNALAAAAQAAGGVDNLTGVEHLTVFVASAPGFTEQHVVANGASELYGEIFGEAAAHTRSAVGVAVLPLDAPVEVEAVFTVRAQA